MKINMLMIFGLMLIAVSNVTAGDVSNVATGDPLPPAWKTAQEKITFLEKDLAQEHQKLEALQRMVFADKLNTARRQMIEKWVNISNETMPKGTWAEIPTMQPGLYFARKLVLPPSETQRNEIISNWDNVATYVHDYKKGSSELKNITSKLVLETGAYQLQFDVLIVTERSSFDIPSGNFVSLFRVRRTGNFNTGEMTDTVDAVDPKFPLGSRKQLS